MYMPKSAIPLQQSPSQTPQTGYMPKTAIPVQPEKKSLGGFIGNVGKSAVKAITDVGQAIAHPIQTGKALYGLGSGVVSKFIPGRQQSEQNVDNLVGAYKEKYKGGLLNTLYNDPVGVALDASTVLGGAGAALRGAGTVGKVAGLTKAGSTLSKVGSAIDPLMATGKAIGAVTNPLFSKIKPAMFAKSEKMLTAGLGNPARQARIADKAGRSVASFIDEYKLYDRNPSTAREVTKQIGSQFDEAAMGSKAKIPVQRIVDSIDAKIAELKSGTGGVISDNTANQIEELTRRKNMFIESVMPKEPSILKPIDTTSPLGGKPLSVEPTGGETLNIKSPVKGKTPKLEYDTGGDMLGDQYNGYIIARDKSGKKIGKVSYSYWNGETQVQMIEVDPKFRRQGIGTALLEKLQSESKSPIGIQGDFATAEGQALFNSFRKNNTVHEALANQISTKITQPQTAILPTFQSSSLTVGAGRVHNPNYTKPLSVEPTGGDSLATDMNNFMDANTPTLKPKPDVLPEMQADMSRQLNLRERVITPGEATTFRRKVIDPDVPKSEFGLNPKDTGKAGGVKAARDIFRKEIMTAVPELEKLGLDYGMAKEVEKIIADAASRASNRQLFNFTKLGSAGVGAFLGGIPGLVGGFITEQLVNSPKFIEITSKMLRSMAESKGTSPLFSKAGNSAYLFGKTGRITAGQTEKPKSTKEEILRPLPEAYSPIIPEPYKVPQIRRPNGR